jgi:uncharacterized protein (TIGR03435 family)
VWGAGITLAVLAVALAVKAVWFPSVDEKFFQLNEDNLARAPAHVFILRPTHFAASKRSGCFAMPDSSGSDPDQMRLVGRNASLAQIIAFTYACSESQVYVPPLATTNRFDFLVTVSRHPLERFHAAVRDKLGYTAHWQQHDAEILLLKVQGYGPTPSAASQEQVIYNVGKLFYRHAPIQEVVNMAEAQFKRPVYDRTGLTGYYDYTIVTPAAGRRDPTDEAFNKSLADMGLTLEADTQPMQMMVVEGVR